MAKKENFVTPAGTLVFGFIAEPNYEYKDDGEYLASIVLPAKEAKPIIEQIDNWIEESVKEAKKKNPKKKVVKADPPYADSVDEEGEPTGDYIIKFKSPASGTSRRTGKRWERTVPVFDAKRHPVNLDEVNLAPGSKIKIAYSEYFWFATGKAGVKLNLNGVQIIELNSGGQSADAFGFDEEDGVDLAVEEVENGSEEEDYEEDEPLF